MSREYPDNPLIGVGAVIVRENRVLLIRRGQPPLLGEWSLPGGVLECGRLFARRRFARRVKKLAWLWKSEKCWECMSV